jgi:uncharacterized protein YndB with AHSA1/START domain
MNMEMVRAAIYIAAPYETIWATLTRPERHEHWYVAPCLQFGWESGATVLWGRPAESVIEGTLTVWEPATRFAHTFRFAALDEPESQVTWHVMPMGEVVYVEVNHLFPGEAPATQAIVTDGWSLVLSRLKTLLETGEPMPWPDQEESDELV